VSTTAAAPLHTSAPLSPALLARTLLDRADATPDVVAYEGVDPLGGRAPLTYAQVACRAAELARRLVDVPDGPVLLALPAGPDYAVAVFGAFLAGRPAVPAAPPGPGSAFDGERLAGVLHDARPAAVVATRRHDGIDVAVVLDVPGVEADGTAPTGLPAVDGSRVAVVQYTSGSTGHPRGTLVTHDNLAANTAAITDRFGLDAESRALTWLPPFHDMGLVGGLLTPVAAGIPMRIMAPGDFLKSPLWWLRQISEDGTTHTGGPDFGYALCLLRARGDDALAGLDLSRWRVAFSGGETVRYRTMAAFAERFGPAGFRAQAFLPCYGLAEATLMVSAGHWPGPVAGSGPDPVVSCGTPVLGQRVVVVDPERGAPVADGVEGEIWVSGPNVTPGYLSGDAGDLFGELDGVRHLRTGDLGHLRGGELHVTGRAKDVIVFRGVNHHAVDVEAAALDAVGRAGRLAAAFLLDSGPDPVPVLVLETRGARDDDLAATARAAVLARTGLRLGAVALLPPRSLPRTSSGKIRRSAARDAFVAGAFDAAVSADPATRAAIEQHRARAGTAGDLAALVCGVLAAVCEVEDCGPGDDLVALGVDSVRAAEAAAVLEHALALPVPLEAMLGVPTAAGVADALVATWLAAGHTPCTVRERVLAVGAGAEVG
jgi:acyl-CoA synthetase (AMP-forming)/AMP-acid ligase II